MLNELGTKIDDVLQSNFADCTYLQLNLFFTNLMPHRSINNFTFKKIPKNLINTHAQHTHIQSHKNILPKNGTVWHSAFANTQHDTAPTEIGTIESQNEECGATVTIGASLADAGLPINFIL